MMRFSNSSRAKPTRGCERAQRFGELRERLQTEALPEELKEALKEKEESPPEVAKRLQRT